MEQTTPFGRMNFFEEHSATISTDTSSWEGLSHQSLQRFIGYATSMYATNAQETSTTTSQFITFQKLLTVTEDARRTFHGRAEEISAHSIIHTCSQVVSNYFVPYFLSIEETHRNSFNFLEDEIPAIHVDESLSPEDKKAREKGLALATRLENLYHTNEHFRHWYHEGFDEIEAGQFVTFSEDGWEKE